MSAPEPMPMPHDPRNRGYCVVYHEDEVNHCPGCGRTHWYVGRVSAECGFCSVKAHRLWHGPSA